MLFHENRSGAYILVREHRKRREIAFAGHLSKNIKLSSQTTDHNTRTRHWPDHANYTTQPDAPAHRRRHRKTPHLYQPTQ